MMSQKFKVKERVCVNSQNYSWSGRKGVVMSYDDDKLYKIKFDDVPNPIFGFEEDELELDTTRFVPLSREDLKLISSSLDDAMEVWIDRSGPEPTSEKYLQLKELHQQINLYL